MKQISIEVKKYKEKSLKEIYSLSVDCGNYHYRLDSHDEDKLIKLKNALDVIVMGLEKEL